MQGVQRGNGKATCCGLLGPTLRNDLNSGEMFVGNFTGSLTMCWMRLQVQDKRDIGGQVTVTGMVMRLWMVSVEPKVACVPIQAAKGEHPKRRTAHL